MTLTTHNRIKRILEEFLSARNVSDELYAEFREWLSGADHLEEKSLAVQELLGSYVSFDPKPGKKVYKSYMNVARRLGFKEDQYNRNNEYKRKPLFGRRAVRVAAVLMPAAVIVGAALFMRYKPDLPDLMPAIAEIHLTVPEGEKKHAVFPDNSSVWLNSRSEIMYEESFDEERVVNLEGEAYFTVMEVENRPFTVATHDLKVTVLGTVFNIDNDAEREVTIISLYEGRLCVDTPYDRYMLEEKHELTYDRSNGEVSVMEIARTKPDWMRNIIDFRLMPATYVLEAIGNIYGYNVHVTGSELADDIVTLKFEDEISFEDVLSIMAEMSGFNYRIRDKDVYIKAK